MIRKRELTGSPGGNSVVDGCGLKVYVYNGLGMFTTPFGELTMISGLFVTFGIAGVSAQSQYGTRRV